MTFTACLFGGHISWGSQNFSFDRHRNLAHFSLGKSEIHNVRFVFPVKHDITRFEIAVNYSLLMGVMKSICNLLTEFRSYMKRRMLTGDPIRQRDAIDEIANDVEFTARFVLPDFMNTDDVGVF